MKIILSKVLLEFENKGDNQMFGHMEKLFNIVYIRYDKWF